MSRPDLSLEAQCLGVVAGVDEAGRGPWAGPVVAAAVVLNRNNVPEGIHDSKQIAKVQHEALYHSITQSADWGVGIASVEEIDRLNILGATKLAMQRAVAALRQKPDMVLVDGNRLPVLPCKAQAIVKGDSRSLSIAAASIIAKVTRDRMMRELAREFPHYGWERNAGYGTAKHQEGLVKYGVTIHHRRSFRPIRELIEKAQ